MNIGDAVFYAFSIGVVIGALTGYFWRNIVDSIRY